MSKGSTPKNDQGPASDWQSSKCIVTESLKHICNTENYADVHFIVGEGKLKQRIPAHRLILSIRSPVFAAMFSDNWSDMSREIEVPDVEVAVFLNLLKFMYYDHVAITADDVMSTLYTAKKYSVRALEDKCVDFLTNNLCAANAFTLLMQAKLFDEPTLVESCVQIIDNQTLAAVQSEGFTNIDLDSLCTVLKRDSLSIREFDLFQATVRWTKAECSRQNLEVNPKNQLSVLNEGFYLIRFPLMTVDQFSSEEVSDSGLLSLEDIGLVMLYFARKNKPKICFSAVPRKGQELIASRFSSTATNLPSGSKESIEFCVDHRVQFTGIALYGTDLVSEAKYDVSLTVFDMSSVSSIIINEKFKDCYHDCSTKVFRIEFAEPVKLIASRIYKIRVEVKGPNTFYGVNGSSDIFIPISGPGNEKVKVSFINANSDTMYTSVSQGQIPELLFRL